MGGCTSRQEVAQKRVQESNGPAAIRPVAVRPARPPPMQVNRQREVPKTVQQLQSQIGDSQVQQQKVESTGTTGDLKSASCSTTLTVHQITVEVEGEKHLVYLDSSRHMLLYEPIVYDPNVGVPSNLTTAFTIVSDNSGSFQLKSYVTPIASPKLTVITPDTRNITMEVTNDTKPVYAEQQRSGLPFALYFSDNLTMERFYIQPRLTDNPNPRKRVLQAVKKAVPTNSDFVFEFISTSVTIPVSTN